MNTKLSAPDARDILAGAMQGKAQGTAAELATQKDVLPLDRTVLIGIVGPTADPAALIRQPSGDILKLKRGDSGPPGTVRAIDEGRVILAKGGRTQVLRLPKP